MIGVRWKQTKKLTTIHLDIYDYGGKVSRIKPTSKERPYWLCDQKIS
jgi:hypothetical protein